MFGNSLKYNFECITFLGDGVTINSVEICNNATEAIKRASEWQKLKLKAQAFLVAIDEKNLEVFHFPLE